MMRERIRHTRPKNEEVMAQKNPLNGFREKTTIKCIVNKINGGVLRSKGRIVVLQYLGEECHYTDTRLATAAETSANY